jgi:hypothetical protein
MPGVLIITYRIFLFFVVDAVCFENFDSYDFFDLTETALCDLSDCLFGSERSI